MDGCILLCGVGIELAAKIFKSAIDLEGLAVGCALEESMLGEVRQAMLRREFIAAAGIDSQSAMGYLAAYLTVYASYSVG